MSDTRRLGMRLLACLSGFLLVPAVWALVPAARALTTVPGSNRGAPGSAEGGRPRAPAESPAARPAMVLIPAGEFMMGAPDSDLIAFPEERPAHRVVIRAFRIDRYEVSNAEYRRFVEATKGAHPKSCSALEPPGTDHAPDPRWGNDIEWNSPEKPVNGMSWFDAYAYCAWAGERLPTEAEWEHAARGGDGRRFAWGASPPGELPVGNLADASVKRLNPKWNTLRGYDDGFAHTAPVGSFPFGASAYGVEDMAGNVWEWTADWWSPSAYGDPNGPPSRSPTLNPKGPAGGEARVLRGGSWDSTPNFARATARHYQRPDYRSVSFGIRCAMDAP